MPTPSKTLPPPPAPPSLPQTLQQRVDELQADIEAYIDSVVAKEAATCPGVPGIENQA